VDLIGVTGPLDGYEFTIDLTRRGFIISGAPVVTGKTGDTLMSIDERDQIKLSADPRAVAIKRRMFQNIRARGLEAIATLMDSDTRRAASELRCLTDSEIVVRTAFSNLDSNGDELVTVQEALNRDRLGNPVLSAFIQFVIDEMALGVGNEDVSKIPGIGIDGLLDQ
jgi:hypothetical protein